MKKVFVGLLSGVLFISPLLMHAAEFASADEHTLRRGETIRGNYYVAGSSVLIEGDIEGDLIVAGGNVTLRGRVARDILAAGGSLTILGEVGEDIRAAGGNVLIGGPIRGEVVVAGGQVRTASDAQISGDVITAGGTVVLDGTINGMVRVAGGDVTVAGRVQRDVDAAVGDLTVARSANIAGKLMYHSPREAKIEGGSTIGGGINYTKVDNRDNKAGMWAVFGLFWFLKLLMMLVAAYVLYWAFPSKFETFGGVMVKNWWRYAGWGVVYTIVFPLACIVLLLTILGIPLGILGLLAYVSIIILAGVMSGVAFGALLDAYVWRREETKLAWYTIGAGIILRSLIGLIPFLGWIVEMLAFLAAAGYIWRGLHRRLWEHERNMA